MSEWWIHCLFSFISTVAFGILTNIPRRALLTCGITGMAGWMIFWMSLQSSTIGNATANFLGALVIGILSVFFSRLKKMPMLVFNIPSLVPLVPGGTAYQAIRAFVLGDYDSGIQFTVKVLVTAGAIAAGFLVTSILEEGSRKVLKKWIYQQNR